MPAGRTCSAIRVSRWWSIEAGTGLELTGVRVDGAAEAVPAEHPDIRGVMSAWHEKYRSMFAGDGFERLTRQVPGLGFLRVKVATADAWDHRTAT